MKNQNKNNDLRTLWWLAFFSVLAMIGLMSWQPSVEAANVSAVNKTANGIVVQGRDGTSSFVRLTGLPLYVQSTNYTITTTDGYENIYVVTGNSNRTITLPSVKSSFGRRVKVTKTDSGTGSVTLAASDGSILGVINPTVAGQNGNLQVDCDGLNWYVGFLRDSGSFTATYGSTTGPVTDTWNFTRNGNNVSVGFSSNNPTFTMTATTSLNLTGFPASLIPTADAYCNNGNVAYNNGGTAGAPVTVKMTTSGMTIFRDNVEDAFGSGTTSVHYKITYSYILK